MEINKGARSFRRPSMGLAALLAVLLNLSILFSACGIGDDQIFRAAPTAGTTSATDEKAEDDPASNRVISGTETLETAGRFDCTAVNQIPSDECESLVTLYNSTNGAGWIDNSGWLTTNTPCSWTGITCTDHHVGHINLSYNQLSGPLQPALGDLSHLRAIELSSNELHGPIPVELGKLSELASLHLWGNRLTGPLPAELGNLDNLRTLSFADNQLSGSIPSSMGSMGSLETLDLSNNQLSGDIPPELGNLDNLYALYLSHNQLRGEIPTAFDSLGKLSELDLRYNQLRGPAPESTSHIEQNMLWGNQLDGTATTNGQTPFNVDYMGVRFSADPSLAASIWPEVKAATPLPEDLDGPSYWLATPEHIRFTFADPYLPPERLRMGFNLAAEGQILVFPVAELAVVNPSVKAEIETLQNLLAEQKVPAGELPLLPLTNSAQVFHAQAQFLDSGAVQGLRYISQHSQDPHPIALSQELFYTFQGFTDDGSHYVAAFFPLTTAVLPDTIEIEDWDAFHANYDAYLSETTASLDQLTLADFTPNLTLLDEVITSLSVESNDSASDISPRSDSIVVEKIPAVGSLALKVDKTKGLFAYQQDGKLWVNQADLSSESVELARCSDQDQIICDLPKVHISPDGSHFFYESDAEGEYRLLISDLQGLQQGFRFSRPLSREPVCSADGQRIVVFIVDPGRPWGDHSDPELPVLEYGFTEEVWQLEIDSSGEWLAPRKVTDLETPASAVAGAASLPATASMISREVLPWLPGWPADGVDQRRRDHLPANLRLLAGIRPA